MPNPYYVAPRSNILAEPTRQMMGLLQLKQQAQLGQAQLSQKERQYQGELPIRTMQAETAARGAKTAGVLAGVAETKSEADKMANIHNAPYSPSTHANAFNQMALKIGKDTMTALKPISDILNFASKGNLTRGQVAKSLTSPSNILRIKKSSENLLNLINKNKDNIAWNEGPEGKIASQMYDLLSTDTTGKKTQQFLFGPTMKAIGTEQFERETARLKGFKQPTLYKTAEGFLPPGQAVGLMPPRKEPTPITEIQKFKRKMSIAETRSTLAGKEDDQEQFNSLSSVYNTENKRNEVAYWKTGKWYTDEKTKFIKLSEEAVKADWTPAKVQNAANTKGMTVEEVLKELGLIK